MTITSMYGTTHIIVHMTCLSYFAGQSEFQLWPVGVVIAISIVLVAGVVTPRLRKGRSSFSAKNEFTVSDYAISDGVLKFYNSKGLLTKKQVPVREIPISKINSIENFWNDLTISWGDIIDTFHRKGEFESFNQELTAKVQALVDENRKALEKQEKMRLRNDLTLRKC